MLVKYHATCLQIWSSYPLNFSLAPEVLSTFLAETAGGSVHGRLGFHRAETVVVSNWVWSVGRVFWTQRFLRNIQCNIPCSMFYASLKHLIDVLALHVLFPCEETKFRSDFQAYQWLTKQARQIVHYVIDGYRWFVRETLNNMFLITLVQLIWGSEIIPTWSTDSSSKVLTTAPFKPFHQVFCFCQFLFSIGWFCPFPSNQGHITIVT